MRRLPVPSALNSALVAGVAGAMGVLVAASPRLSGAGLAAATLAYAALFQTAFSLLHESAHLKLHADPRWNRALGLAVGTIFGLSATMFAVTHWSHHLKNRSAEEAFDQVAPGERRWVKAIGWYGMLGSLWYWVIPSANLAILVAPGAVEALARRVRIADRVFDRWPEIGRAVRLELGLWVAAVAVALSIAGWRAVLLQAAAAWWWSSCNYVEHAYAPRDVAAGAWNLDAWAPYGWLNLHRELDRTHHLWPDESWVHLPRLTTARDGSFARAWLRQWRGPVRSDEIAPAPLASIPPRELP